MWLTWHLYHTDIAVSDLGFPSRGQCVPVTRFFYSNVPGFMLSTNAMFKSELDIITVIIWNYCWSPVVCTTNGKRILFLWFLAKPTEHTLWISGSHFRDLDFPSQLCWKFRFGNFDFDSLDWSFSGSASTITVDISAVSSLCSCPPKNAENLICFDLTLHSRTSREGLSIKHVDLRNLPP